MALAYNYEGTIQALSNQDVMPNVFQVTSKLLTEAHTMVIRNKQLGDEEVLAVNFS